VLQSYWRGGRVAPDQALVFPPKPVGRRDNALSDRRRVTSYCLEENQGQEELLRGSRSAQKPPAMKLFAGAVERLAQDGIPKGLLSGIDGPEIAQAAAERFDRSVNPGKFRPRLRLFGPSRT
jgi:hypothetical protein